MHNACKRYGLQVFQKLKQEFYIKQVSWSTHEAALRTIRTQVFIQEQQVPESMEWDHFDASARHLIGYDTQHHVIACARILDDGSIGRMAVVKEKRGQGIGYALLDKAIALCQACGVKQATLSAQTHAIPFYEKAGFTVSSEPYLDANIWHVDMQRNI
jgi:predicted GNAT family N-acyltransferase